MEDFGTHAEGFGEILGADGHYHEFLEVDVVIGVLAAVEDVHHWNGEDVGIAAAEVPVKRHLGGVGGGLCDGE